eukprot:gnl/TRDRNA2_/TRDRNA2_157157_c4_seq1.p1 gnl/TRDRNA2_/TRDRNA2_157157_c4~~gnl/TRDRNA2_/TRDRNA2_157157_c4_seq1.p1  ORF type:complete len:140 (-),score=0.76 gnl/TRDRNA2_/TRDRNA2_157157_c4_seq1:98-517(-)
MAYVTRSGCETVSSTGPSSRIPSCTHFMSPGLSGFLRSAEKRIQTFRPSDCHRHCLSEGRRLSTEHQRSQSKLGWECEYGHQWTASLNSIKDHKSWCPFCASLSCGTTCKLDGVRIARDIAARRGGRCSSTMYRNDHDI